MILKYLEVTYAKHRFLNVFGQDDLNPFQSTKDLAFRCRWRDVSMLLGLFVVLAALRTWYVGGALVF